MTSFEEFNKSLEEHGFDRYKDDGELRAFLAATWVDGNSANFVYTTNITPEYADSVLKKLVDARKQKEK